MSTQISQGKVERVVTACRNCRQRKVRLVVILVRIASDYRESVSIPYLRKRKLHSIRNVEARRQPFESSPEQSGDGTIFSTTTSRIQDSQRRSPKPAAKEVAVLSTVQEACDPVFSPQTQRNLNSPAPPTDYRVSPRPATPGARSLCDLGDSNQTYDIDTLESSIYEDHLEQPLSDMNRDYHEPWSWTSICSDIGSEWTYGVTGCRSFVSTLKNFANDLKCRSSIATNLVTSRTSVEVDEKTAWQYVDAFYSNGWESDMGIIYRADFEKLLRSHFREHTLRNDPAWFALRNVVFATGYRSLLAKDASASFAAAYSKSGSLFKNALSTLAQLLLGPRSIMALQALTLMAFYVEGLGHATSHQILCSNAAYLAQARGLHLQPDNSAPSIADETLKRYWLWWPIYVIEKHASFRNGQPSVIDDHNMSSQIPLAVPPGSHLHLQNMSIAIRHANIHSQISRKLLSSKAMQLSTNELIDLVAHFHAQLKQLLEDIPPEFRIGTLARPTHSGSRLIHVLYLHFSIYGSLMSLHAHFFYPWMTARYAAEGYNAALEAQLASSPGIVAEAARQIILAIRLVNTDVTTPSWLTYYYPIHATINLFIYLLKYPTLSSVSADLGLLDVCAGHFGYMEFLTSSQVSISLAREAANLASKVVKAARETNSMSHDWGNSSVSRDSRIKSHNNLENDFDGHMLGTDQTIESFPLHDPLIWLSSTRETLDY